jgi:hypothetical protein
MKLTEMCLRRTGFKGQGHLAVVASKLEAAPARFILWRKRMSYRIVYNEIRTLPVAKDRRRGAVSTEEFPTEHQALGRARELLEASEHHAVAVRDHHGNELFGVRLQWRLGGFAGE